jgi:hypothetical protein
VTHGRDTKAGCALPSARTGAPAAPGRSVLEKIFAATIVAGCLVLLLRVVLGVRRRARFDAALARWSHRIGARTDALFAWPAARRRARREAEAAIRRAREGGEWDGNVFRPKSFRNKRKMH